MPCDGPSPDELSDSDAGAEVVVEVLAAAGADIFMGDFTEIGDTSGFLGEDLTRG